MAEEKYVSGEEHRQMVTHRTSGLPKQPIVLVVAAILLVGVGILGASAYQKSKQTSQTNANSSATGRRFGGNRVGGRLGGQRPTRGLVIAISPTSISIQAATSSTVTTLAITSSTQISDNNQTVAAGDITVGANVLAIASPTDQTQADRILVNPNYGGGGIGGHGPAPTPTSGATTN